MRHAFAGQLRVNNDFFLLLHWFTDRLKFCGQDLLADCVILFSKKKCEAPFYLLT